MSTYKLIALDMDGTLLNNKQEISPENRAAIHAAYAAGAIVILSTGRGFQSALPYASDLGLDTPMVTVNGSEVWKSPKELLKRDLLSPQLVLDMHEIANNFDTWWWAYAVDGIYNRDIPYEDAYSKQWLKFGYYTEDAKALPQIRRMIEEWDQLEITNSHPCNLELNPKGVNKATGVREVCKLLGIEMSQVIAMGDSENDIAMIREAGLGVAMGNAQEEVKRIADLTTISNVEHGVAKIINEYVLKV
ncbi:Sugar phosphatase YidA [compost metagenome]